MPRVTERKSAIHRQAEQGLNPDQAAAALQVRLSHRLS